MSDRLQKVISRAGLMSRRVAEDLIAAGRITIDGRTAILGDRCDPATERVEIDGSPIPVAPDLETWLLNKPEGAISTVEDTHGRETVVDLIATETRLWPVGRLDADSEGLILLSNDGELTHRITHPSFGVTKTYLVLVDGLLSPAEVRMLTDGVMLDDGHAAAKRARIIDRSADATMLEMIMTEGRNREIRRMGEAIGHPVQRLVRTAIGTLTDKTLAPGESRRLSPHEVTELYRTADKPSR